MPITEQRRRQLYQLADAELGIGPPVKEGMVTEAVQAAQLAGASMLARFGATAEAFGVSQGGIRRAAEEYIAERPEILPSPGYKALSLDPSHLARTAAGGITTSVPALGAGVAATIATGSPAVGTAAAFAVSFGSIYGQEVQDYRKALPDSLSEETKDRLALASSVGQAAVESFFGPEALVGGFASKAFMTSAKNAVKKSVIKTALAAGAEEAFEEVFQDGLSRAIKEIGGAELPPITLRGALETAAGGFIPGAILGGGMRLAGGAPANAAPAVDETAAPEVAPVVEPGAATVDVEPTAPVVERLADEAARAQQEDFAKRYDVSEEVDQEASKILTEKYNRPIEARIANPRTRRDKTAQIVGQLLGLDVQFVQSDADATNGFMVPKTNKIYIHADPEADPSMVVLGHEFDHYLKSTSPDLHAAWQGVVSQSASKSKAREMRVGLEAAGVVEEDLLDETSATVMGDMFGDPEMWSRVKAEDRPLFQRLAAAVIRFIDSVKARLKGKASVEGFLTDLDSVRDAAAMLVEDARNKKAEKKRGLAEVDARTAKDLVAQEARKRSDEWDSQQAQMEAAAAQKTQDQAEKSKNRLSESIYRTSQLDVDEQARISEGQMQIAEEQAALADERFERDAAESRMNRRWYDMAGVNLPSDRLTAEQRATRDTIRRKLKAIGVPPKSVTLQQGIQILAQREADRGVRQPRFSQRARPDLAVPAGVGEAGTEILNEVDRERGKPAFITDAARRAEAKAAIDEAGARNFANDLLAGKVKVPEDPNSQALHIQKVIETFEELSSEHASTLNFETKKLAAKVGGAYRTLMSAQGLGLRVGHGGLAGANKDPSLARKAAINMALVDTSRPTYVANMLKKQFNFDVANPDYDMLSNPKTFRDMMRAIKQADSTLPDYLFEYWMHWGLLSSPGTVLVNPISTGAFIGWELTMQRAAEAALSFAKEKITGRRTKGAATAGEFKYMTAKLAPHLKAAQQRFSSSFSSGEPQDGRSLFEHHGYIPEDVRMRLPSFKSEEVIYRNAREDAVKRGLSDPDTFASKQLEKHINRGVKLPFIKGSIVRLPGRLNMAFDEFMKGVVQQQEAVAFAYREAVDKKIKGDAAISKYIDQQLSDPESHASLYGANRAIELSFQGDPGMLGTALMHAKMTERGKGLRWLFPFVRTPSNLIRLGARKSPLGSISLANHLRKEITRYLGDPEAYEMDAKTINYAAEQALAWSVVGALMSAIGGGDEPWITGSRPDYRSGEYGFKMANLPPQSIRIGDTWLSYSRIDPFSTAITAIVDGVNAFFDAKDGKEMSRVVNDLLRTGKSTFRDKTYLKTVGDLLRAGESQQGISYIAENFASSFVPSVVRAARRAADPNVREGTRTEDRPFMTRVTDRAQLTRPYPRVDVWGDDVEWTGYEPSVGEWAFRFLFPMYRKHTDGMSGPERVLWNWNQNNPNQPYWPKTGRLTGFTSAEGYRYARERGRYAKHRIERMIESGRINTESPTAKDVEAIKRVFSKAAKIAGKKVRRR